MKFKERALIEAEIHEIKERQRKRQQLQEIKLFASFEETIPNESSEYFVDATVAPNQPIQQPVQNQSVQFTTFSTTPREDAPVVKPSYQEPVNNNGVQHAPVYEPYTEPQQPQMYNEPFNPNTMANTQPFVQTNQQNNPNGHSVNNVQSMPAPPVQPPQVEEDDFFKGLGFGK